MTVSTQQTHFDQALLRSLFDRVYVINLAERTDRRREMEAQLALVGLEDDPLVHFYPAVRPADKGNFRSIGELGCFMSHLGILKDAVANGHQSILILEDDADWTPAALARNARLEALRDTGWAYFHGGPGHDRASPDGTIALVRLDPEQPLMLTHCIAFRGPIIEQMVGHLEAILRRPPGSPEGGPMPVDGAYFWFRRAHPEVAAYVCVPSLAVQRSSRSDISVPTGWRATAAADWARKLLRPVRSLLRKG